jgi:hypothetical protein
MRVKSLLNKQSFGLYCGDPLKPGELLKILMQVRNPVDLSALDKSASKLIFTGKYKDYSGDHDNYQTGED